MLFSIFGGKSCLKKVELIDIYCQLTDLCLIVFLCLLCKVIFELFMCNFWRAANTVRVPHEWYLGHPEGVNV